MRVVAASLSCLALALALAGCPAKVATVEVTPAKVELKSDTESKKLSATPKDEAGNVIEDERPVTWSSADPAVATVDGNGLVKPAGSGKTTITAKIEEQSGSASVEVVLLKRIQLPAPVMVVVAGVASEPLTVQFLNEKGEPITVSPEEGKVTWKTADPAIATVSDTGVVTGVAAGSTLLTATVKDLKAEMNVTVNPPPEPVPPEPEPPTKGKKKK